MVDAGQNVTICQGESTPLNATVSGGSGSYTYTWTGAGLSNNNIANPIATPTSTTTYTVVVEDTEGCIEAAQVTVSITASPTADAGLNDIICSGEAVTLSGSATGGDGNYAYAWTGVGLSDNNIANPIATPAVTTIYTLEVTDGNGCTDIDQVEIVVLDAPIAEAGAIIFTCDNQPVMLDGSATGGDGSYTYFWTGAGLDNPNIANPTATISSSTTYTLLVTDGNGCTSTDQVTVNAMGTVPTASATDAEICLDETTTLIATGGTTYLWTEITGNPATGTLSNTSTDNPTFTPTAAGTYNFSVAVTGGCEDLLIAVSVEVSEIQLTATQTNLDQCNGDAQNATISINENIASYTINGGAFQTDATSGNTLTFEALFDASANNYIVEITGVSGCTVSTSFTFVECACIPPVITGVLTNNSNCGESIGSASINIIGNPTDYNFAWTPNVGTPSADGTTRTDLPAGTYTVNIASVDDTTCNDETIIIISNNDGPQPTVSTTPATCAAADGTATLLPSTWTYAWSDGGAGNVRNDLPRGTYGVTVTDPTNPTCPNVIPVIILEDNDLEVSHVVNNTPTCGNTDGAVTISVTGGTAPFDYVWSDSGTGAVRTDLAAGTYAVEITEAAGNGCSTTYVFAITDGNVPNAMVNIASVNDITCTGANNGGIDFTIDYPSTIATPTDTIFTNGFTPQTNGSLSAGQYCIEIRDAAGCVSGAACFEIEEPAPISANIATTSACGSGGNIDVTATGGTGFLFYDWADVPGTNNAPDRTGLLAGNYSLEISDVNGCSLSLGGGITIEECPCDVEPQINAVIVNEATCGNSDGSATLLVNADASQLNITWLPDVGTPNGLGRTDLPAGGYTVTVADLSGECSATTQFVITNQDGPEPTSVSTTDADCEAANGTATILPPNFSYSWSDGGIGDVRTDLTAGTYFVTLTDPADANCPGVIEITIGQNIDLDITVNTDTAPTCGNTDGAVSVTVSGGSGDYSYAWSFGGTNQSETGIPSGIYNVTVTDNDGNGCSDTQSFVLIDSDVAGADLAINSINDVTCNNAADGGIDFDVTLNPGFNAPEQIIISNGNTNFVNGSLSGGNYCIAVLDAQGCVNAGFCFDIEEPDALDVQISITDGCGSSGEITTTISGGTEPYAFDWGDLPGASNGGDRTGLDAGTYDLSITDTNGCSLEVNGITIVCEEECETAPQANGVIIDEATCGNNDGQATILTNLPASELTFVWTPDIGTVSPMGEDSRVDLPAGGYTVEVRDTAGICPSVFISFAITNEDGPNVTDIMTTNANCAAADGTATLLPALLDYNWSDGGTGNVRNDLEAGTYFVSVTSVLDPDCPSVIEVTIGQDNNLDGSVTVDMAPTCGNNDATVTATATDGSGNYAYAWSSGDMGQTVTGLSSGIYNVTITDLDGNGCETVVPFALNDSDVAAANITIDNINNISCVGDDNGGIAYTITFEPGFNAPEQIIISDGNTTFDNGELSSGEYCLAVLDAAGCMAGSVCFEIEEPIAPLEVEFSLVGGCNDDGGISLDITGGTEPYNVDWLDLAGNDNVEDRTDLPGGIYAVIITDANGCSVAATNLVVNCDDCNGPTVNFTATFDSECGESIGSAQVSIAEDPANFEFEWMPNGVGNLNANGTQLSNIPAGIYSLLIKDTLNTSCSSDTILFAVQNSDGPQAEVDTIIAATCGLADGSVTLSPDTLNYEWTDGGTGAIRNDLTAGTYGVVFFDDADSACINTILVTVPENDGFELEANINQLPDCNTANGNVTIDVTGGSGNFTFSWSDGGTGQTRTDLTSGTYTVFVLDNDTGCSNELVFTLLDNVPQTATITINDITPIACNGVGEGAVDFDVVLDPAFNAPAEIIISDGLQTYDENSLPMGEYCISVRDAEGCLVTAECFEVTEAEELQVSINGMLAGCPDSGELGSLDLTVTGGTAPYTYDWADILTGVEPEDRLDLVIGIYNVTVTDANGCSKEINNLAVDTDCIVDCGIFDADTVDLSVFDCSVGADFCMDIPIADYLAGEYDVYLDGDLQPQLAGCTTSDVGGYNYLLVFGQGNAGPYFLDSWTVNGVVFSGEFPDMPALVDSMNVWDAGGDWENISIASLISGGNPDNTYGNMTIYPVFDPQSSATLSFNAGVSSNGVLLTVGEGMHEVIIVNNGSQGCTDTLSINVTCLNLDVTDTLLLGSATTFCLDSMQLADFGVVSNPSTVTNVCPGSSGTHVEFITDDSLCVTYNSIAIGTDTACIELCDDMGVCDTINFYVTVIPTGPETIFDTIVVNVDTQTICLDTLMDLTGTIVDVENFCEDSDVFAEFEIDTNTWCITYYGVDVGIDTACFAVTDSNGNMDTLNIIVTVIEPTPEFVYDTIFVGEAIQFCLDTTELLSPIATIENACPGESGEFVDFFTDDGTWCVTYEGVEELGTDTACIVICDMLGYCDTTYFYITVEEYFDPPIAMDDYDTTIINTPIVVNVKLNDTVFGGIDTLYIIDGPQVGQADLNLDCTITYQPDEGVCSVTDEFTYVVCNPNGCDTATVYIYIECEGLVIFNGFSPNGDDINSTFFIDGIEDYPNNELCIYNRWGNEVYRTTGYNNEWDGRWNGYDLPDGTYFYYLKLNDEENREFKGYLQIFR